MGKVNDVGTTQNDKEDPIPTVSIQHASFCILELVRIPNVFTAPADVLAGFFYVGGGFERGWTIVFLSMSSACLYAGGIALNDAADAKRDASTRPERPIPSGRVSRRTALLLAIGLLAAGVGFAASVSPRSAAVAAGIVAAIVIYDVVVKTTPFAPPMMGACRALNLLLGASAMSGAWPWAILLPIGCVWLYITSVTVFARTEADVSTRRRLQAGAGGALLAVVGLSAIAILRQPYHAGYLIVVAGLLIALARTAHAAILSRQPAQVQRAVKTFLLGLVIFDAAIAYAAGGLAAGCLVGALLLPTILLGRKFRAT